MIRAACTLTILALLAACTQRPVATTRQPAPIAPAPHSLAVTRTLPKQATYDRYATDLTLHNTYDKSMWFLIRRAGEVRLNDEAKFLPGGLKEPIQLERYYGYAPDGGILRVTGIKFLSYKKREGGFHAFLLPPGGTLIIHDWELTVYQGQKAEFEVLEASKLMVNRETPMEEWVGLILTAPEQVEAWNLNPLESTTQPATAPADPRVNKLKIWSRQAETEYAKNRVKLPKDELYVVNAEEIKRYVLPIAGYVYVPPAE